MCNVARWGTHVKQVANEACSNAKSCKVTMSSPPTLAKNVNEKKQHRGSHIILDMQGHNKKNCKTITNNGNRKQLKR
jgi:hypothetical protein